MRKILLTLFLTLLCATASAATTIELGHIRQGELDLVYPLVYVDDQHARERINRDIARRVYSLKARYDSGELIRASMDYAFTYQDDDAISFRLSYRTLHDPRAAHGHYWDEGAVYDKHTGELIPLERYVRIRDAGQLLTCLQTGILEEYDASGTKVDFYNVRGWEPERISRDYILTGKDSLDLLYPTYELGPYSAGTIRVRFDGWAIGYFNKADAR